MTDDDLKRLQELCDRATPGPWVAERDASSHRGKVHERSPGGAELIATVYCGAFEGHGFRNAELIAAMRTHLPALLADHARLVASERALLESFHRVTVERDAARAEVERLRLAPEVVMTMTSPAPPKPWQIAKSIGIDAGCGDNSCLWGSPGGMATNGGCRCAEKGADAHAARLELRKALRVLRHVLEQSKWRIS